MFFSTASCQRSPDLALTSLLFLIYTDHAQHNYKTTQHNIPSHHTTDFALTRIIITIIIIIAINRHHPHPSGSERSGGGGGGRLVAQPPPHVIHSEFLLITPLITQLLRALLYGESSEAQNTRRLAR